MTPLRTIALLLIGTPALLTGCVSELPVDAARLNGYEAYQGGDYETARQYFTDCLDRQPTDWKSHYYLAKIAMERRGDAAFAQRHLELAHTIRESMPDTQLSARPGSAETGVPYPSRGQIADALAQAMHMQGKHPQMVGFLRQEIDQHGTVRDYLRLARYLRKAGDHDGARTAYRNAIKIAPPDDAEPYLRLAEFYDQLGAKERARRQLRIAYGIDPDQPGLEQALRQHNLTPRPSIALPPEAADLDQSAPTSGEPVEEPTDKATQTDEAGSSRGAGTDEPSDGGSTGRGQSEADGSASGADGPAEG